MSSKNKFSIFKKSENPEVPKVHLTFIEEDIEKSEQPKVHVYNPLENEIKKNEDEKIVNTPDELLNKNKLR